MKKKRIKVRKKVVPKDIILNPTLPEEFFSSVHDLRLMEKTIDALQQKAQENNIPFDVLEEVMQRGMRASGTIQGGFNRVNAYLAKGSNYHTDDADLREIRRKRMANFVAFRDGIGN